MSNESHTRSGQDFENDVLSGVSEDRIDYKKLFFWSVLGTAVVALVVVVIINIYDFTMTNATRKAAEKSQYHDVQALRQQDDETLNSFGLVDADKGIYRVPIDSAIKLLATDADAAGQP